MKINYQKLPYAEWPEHAKDRMRKAAKDRYWADREQAAKNSKVWREANKDYIREKQRLDKRERKLKAIAYLGGVCSKCGGSFHPACFEFHHPVEEEKIKDPSKLLSHSWEVLVTELDKCVLLCANCHRIEHHKYE